MKGATLGDVQAQLRLASLDLAPPVTRTNTESALRWLRLAAEQDHPQGHNGLAWVLATTRFDQLRDGATAVVEANRATALARTASTLDTLAAAYAESGDFDKAVATQRDALAALAERPARVARCVRTASRSLSEATTLARVIAGTHAIGLQTWPAGAFLVQHVRFFARLYA